jgi:hypothetical protein
MQHAAAPLRKHKISNAKEIIELCNCSCLNLSKIYSILFNLLNPSVQNNSVFCNVKTENYSDQENGRI